MLKRFQNAGHRVLTLAGGATGMIGDPRDVGERSMLSEEEIAHNIAAIQDQIRSFIDYTNSKTIMINNTD